MHQIRLGWNDYFSGTSIATTEQGSFTSRRAHSTSSVYVINCLFNNCSSVSAGGALYCTSSYLLVESTSFFSCKTSSGAGGAIRFINTASGQCVLHGVCGYDCIITNGDWGLFVRINVYDSIMSKNYINYSSISRCVELNYGSYNVLGLNNGKILLPSTNISMNKCSYRPAMYCYPFSDSSSVICSLSYTSIVDNYATSENCIMFYRTGAKSEIKCCNILRNTQNSLNSLGTIYAGGNLMIEGSCILENTANCIFYQASSSYTITLLNCTVDKTTNNGYLTIQSTVTKSFIHGLNHMSTQNCQSEYDSVGYLTAIPYVSHPTKTDSCNCYTNKINHYQARISDFFSFICLFMFKFIHLDPSSDFWYDFD
jgi:hypothetical protein